MYNPAISKYYYYYYVGNVYFWYLQYFDTHMYMCRDTQKSGADICVIRICVVV